MRIDFTDGSTYEIDNEYWQKAVVTKGRDNGMDEHGTLAYLKESIESYFFDKKVLTKFGDERWSKDYKDMAALAPDCVYGWIRAYLFAIAFADFGGKAKVVVPNEEGGLDEITPDGKRPEPDGGD